MRCAPTSTITERPVCEAIELDRRLRVTLSAIRRDLLPQVLGRAEACPSEFTLHRVNSSTVSTIHGSRFRVFPVVLSSCSLAVASPLPATISYLPSLDYCLS